MLALVVAVQSAALCLAARSRVASARRRGERGQATAEYALVLLGVAVVALALGSWASGTNLIGRLFDAVLDSLLSKVR